VLTETIILSSMGYRQNVTVNESVLTDITDRNPSSVHSLIVSNSVEKYNFEELFWLITFNENDDG
jgi:hypothetical protein